MRPSIRTLVERRVTKVLLILASVCIAETGLSPSEAPAECVRLELVALLPHLLPSGPVSCMPFLPRHLSSCLPNLSHPVLGLPPHKKSLISLHSTLRVGSYVFRMYQSIPHISVIPIPARFLKAGLSPFLVYLCNCSLPTALYCHAHRCHMFFFNVITFILFLI